MYDFRTSEVKKHHLVFLVLGSFGSTLDYTEACGVWGLEVKRKDPEREREEREGERGR